jgi:ectoine hydroxylase-related dioxygenase (phytanoyl-CoA dioxygenase family)
MPSPFSAISMVANVNYALTPYSRPAGALAMVPGSHRLLRQPTAAENFKPPGTDGGDWIDPPGVVTMEIAPGDAVVWHGNTWHGGHRRELDGIRMNLSAYFCRQPIQPQERHNDPARQQVLDRHAGDPRMAVLLGAKQPYGWREEGPNYELMARSPRGLYD